mmetsp:Transcript_14002/g.21788  ORF Transcript_14002/g.21788 Transcript_14002/m.21788 type:complete len:127 (-) Transcript_14002:100-480(-)
MIEEINTLKIKSGGLGSLGLHYEQLGPTLRQQIEHDEAATVMTHNRIMIHVQQKLDAVHAALLREKTAREEDSEKLNVLAEEMMKNLQSKLLSERDQREEMERELLDLIRSTVAKLHKKYKDEDPP